MSKLIRTLAAAPVLAGAVLLAAPAGSVPSRQADDTPQPGFWEYTTQIPGDRNTERKCVRPSEINRFFGGLSTRRWRCTYPVRVVGNGNARFEGTCTEVKKDGRTGARVNVRLNGPYTAESFTFRGGAQVLRGTPYISASITARRLAAQCPANAEYF